MSCLFTLNYSSLLVQILAKANELKFPNLFVITHAAKT